ncbi:hypothetical protein BH09PAT4_BH09PAT4_00390 [soil metagenome]
MHIIIPVRDEAQNIGPLLEQISTSGVVERVDFIDDSANTRTTDVVNQEASKYAFTVTSYLRQQQAWGGLAGAVIDGLERAAHAGASFVVIMDGDLQHDPAYLPAIYQRLMEGAHIVATTRYAAGGSREGLDGPVRYFVSWASTVAAKILFPRSLAGVSDPMTGYFGLRLHSIDLDALRQAKGFKVLLEIMVSHDLPLTEVPVVFRAREAGTSKGTFGRGVEYLDQLLRLRLLRSLLWFRPRQEMKDAPATR